MERDMWLQLVPLVRRLSPAPASQRYDFGWDEILLTFLWAVLWTRPMSWACHPANWPDDLRPARLPSCATLSRRLRDPVINALLGRLIRHLQRGRARGLLACIDGKPLFVARHSRDPDARWGWGAGGRGKGFKFHLVYGENDRIEAFAVTPLNVNESVVGAALLQRSRLDGYLLADAQYDVNDLHHLCRTRGVQLVTPRQRPGTGLGHRHHDPGRYRSVALLEDPDNDFGRVLFTERGRIERFFGQLASVSYGLFALPPWVRRIWRVTTWVTARLILFALVRRRRKTPA